MATITPGQIVLLLNASLDLINLLRSIAPDITPGNIDDALSKRQAEIDAIAKEVER